MKKLFLLLFVFSSLNAFCQDEWDGMNESKYFLRPEIEMIRSYAAYLNFGYQVLPNYSIGAGVGYSVDYKGSVYDIRYCEIMPFTLNNRFYLTNSELRLFFDIRIGYIFGLISRSDNHRKLEFFKEANLYGSVCPGLNYKKWDFGVNLIYYEFTSSTKDSSHFIPCLKIGYNIPL